MEVMAGRPVTIRLLDPPLHEFVPENPDERQRLAESLGISIDKLNSRAENLHETNPMMGHRGVRLGITYPEVSEMQIRAILEGAAELIKEGKKALPEIMIPVVCDVAEFKNQADSGEKDLSGSAGKIRTEENTVYGGNNDRNSARGAAGRQDCRRSGIFQLWNERSHPDDLRLQP
jgi:phosphoenolpyruvate synthase/pyruvate phosphate dikinase